MRAETYKWIRYSAIAAALLLNVFVLAFCLWLVFTRSWQAPLDPAISAGGRFLVLPTLLAHAPELVSVFPLSLMTSILSFAAIAGISGLSGSRLLWLPGLALFVGFAATHFTAGLDPRLFLDPGLAGATGGKAALNPASVYSVAAVIQCTLLLVTTAITAVVSEKDAHPYS